MCGFAGFYQSSQSSRSVMIDELEKMSVTLHHRGPDDNGFWVDEKHGLGLAHRRLSIQDLSPLGHQPMHSANKRFTIIYNGEIYNFIELRETLIKEGYSFRGDSDTEVMLVAFTAWGIQKSLENFTGMFAFALWDRHKHTLTLARDRLGEKPLYYGWQNKTFLFGSELKALRIHHDWQNDIDRDAITLLLRHNYIPSPYSIFKGIAKLLPGTFLTLDVKTRNTVINTYWSLKETYEYGIRNPIRDDPKEIVNMLEKHLQASIRRQMISDVPIGAFLSGGIDSSTIVALMQSISTSRVKTFTMGFNENDFNEAKYAKAISQRLGTDHTEMYVSTREALEVIPDLPHIYDEPFADSSQIPTYLISRLARQRVTVSLSGDGGDELFCGYTRYFKMQRRWHALQQNPKLFRLIAGNLINKIPESLLDKSLGFLLKNFSERNHYQAGERAHARAGFMLQQSLQLAYQQDISYWRNDNVVIDAKEPEYALNDKKVNLSQGPILQQLQYLDALCYLPDDILVKVDRAAMGNSLETRIPLLDHNIVEFAARIPPAVNTLHAGGKWPLRQILNKYIPQEMIERPKMGFAVPINSWIKGPLSEWAEDLLNESRVKKDGIFDANKVNRKWDAHKLGIADNSFQLWGILMFQAWHANWHQ